MKALIRMTCCLLMLPSVAFATQDNLYIYPASGQTEQQLEQDRYHCYVWASRETGFDPTSTQPVTRMVKVPVGANKNKGAASAGTVVGTIAGAAIGSRHHRVAEGAIVGAVAGTVIGSVIEDSGQKAARQEAEQKAEDVAQQQQDAALGKSEYRRAFSACLEGKGYVVR